MLRRRLILAAIGFVVLMAPMPVLAQSGAPETKPVLAAIQATVVRTIGAEPQTVEIALAGNILTVERVNSRMNASTHAGRDNEAKAIGAVVERGIADKPAFAHLIVIRVQYLARTAGGDRKVVDTIEFRKDAGGQFQFHQT